MAIVKTTAGARDSRLDASFSSASRDSASSDGDEDARTESGSSSESNGSDVSEVDSGMESDDYDYSELGEAGSEFCQVGSQSCLVPYELYDLQDFTSILSIDAWNNCLTEEDRFALAEYLPDMDQEMFMQTLKELFAGDNFHFGSPMMQLFNQLKGGLCEPRVVLYRRGLNYLQKREHYHWLCKYHNSMVGSLVWIRDAWENYAGYGIEDRLQVLNMLRNRRPLKYAENRGLSSEINSEDEEVGEVDWKRRLKMGRRPLYPPKPSLNVLSCRTGVPLESSRYGKENPKGTLKLAGSKASMRKGYIGPTGKVHPSATHTQGTKGRGTVPVVFPPHMDKGAEIDHRTKVRIQNRMEDYDDNDEFDDDMADQDYEINGYRETKNKPGKKQKILKKQGWSSPSELHEEENSRYNVLSLSSGKRDASQVVTKALYDPRSLKKPRHLDRDKGHPMEDNAQDYAPRRDWVDGSAGARHSQKGLSARHSEKNNKSKKSEMEDLKVNNQNFVHGQTGSTRLYPEQLSKSPLRNIRKKASQNGLRDTGYGRVHSAYVQSEDTESDSSDQEDEEENFTDYSRRIGHPSVDAKKHLNATVRSSYDSKDINKPLKKNKKDIAQAYDRAAKSQMPVADMYMQKVQKSKALGYAGESRMPSGKFTDDQRHAYKMMEELDGNLSRGAFVKNPGMGRKKKGHDPDYSLPQSNYVDDYACGILEEDADELPVSIDGETCVKTPGNRGQVADAHTVDSDNNEPMHMPLVGCKTVTKKKKGKAENKHLDGKEEPEYRHDSPGKLTDSLSSLKKRGKRITEAGTGPLAAAIRDPISPENETVIEMETKPARKPFSLITPTVHTGFSFSIVHLLSAVRMAMIATSVEDTTEVGNITRDENGDTNASEKQKHMPSLTGHMPSLTVQEIVNRVRSNPGDPSILETQEPLQDLVRGVLKIFSSKTAPLGAKGWKALVIYEKSTKSWSWVGPVLPSTSDPVEEETSAEAWNIPHKMLVKLVDAFANWLKSGQDTLRQIGSLPPPPIMVLPNLDEKERFRDLRAQKSLITISPSSDDVRAYFRKEEFLRYQVPDRAFSYTAADGKKSIVAPLRRGGGKPTSKARDHFMLKPDRPPHVTILCLVRDAASRLPGSIGTRADVCTLIRDSQYIVEDVSDGQVNQVVSGALDRLHYERDPCVQYDSERKLWVYLHRDREEEDFEDDGTSSTKKWKKPRKDATENPDAGVAADADFHGGGDQAACDTPGYDINVNFNAEPCSGAVAEKPELVFNDLRPNTENIEPFLDSVQGSTHQGHPMHWGVLGLNDAQQENQMLCQENCTNEDFDDEAFIRGRPTGQLNASLL